MGSIYDVLLGSTPQLCGAENETFTGTAARTGTYKRPLLLVDGKRYEPVRIMTQLAGMMRTRLLNKLNQQLQQADFPRLIDANEHGVSLFDFASDAYEQWLEGLPCVEKRSDGTVRAFAHPELARDVWPTIQPICIRLEANGKADLGVRLERAFREVEDYARIIGVNMEDLLINQPDSAEQALDVVEALVRSNALDVVVIDSVAALVPKAELEGEMGDATWDCRPA
jgi:hypothetical protein